MNDHKQKAASLLKININRVLSVDIREKCVTVHIKNGSSDWVNIPIEVWDGMTEEEYINKRSDNRKKYTEFEVPAKLFKSFLRFNHVCIRAEGDHIDVAYEGRTVRHNERYSTIVHGSGMATVKISKDLKAFLRECDRNITVAFYYGIVTFSCDTKSISIAL